jgi:hypothetical protein
MEADLNLQDIYFYINGRISPRTRWKSILCISQQWNYSGQLIKNGWKYSKDKSKLSIVKLLSTTMPLEKKGKGTEQPNNLRPITLTNCSLK